MNGGFPHDQPPALRGATRGIALSIFTVYDAFNIGGALAHLEKTSMTMNPPKSLAEAMDQIQALEAKLQTARTDAIRDVVSILQVEGSAFYHNKPNDYGCITINLFTGAGDPWELFRGQEVQGTFLDGVRGTGRYLLNDAIIPVILKKIGDAPQSAPYPREQALG